MKILVTGVAGFIGSHVAKSLLIEGHEVIGIDNLNNYYDVELKHARLNSIDKSLKFTFYKLDLTDKDAISGLFKEERFDVVVHLAAQAGVRYGIENPFSYVDSNLIGMMTILEGCRHNNIKHLIFASSSSVYGLNKKVPYSEEDKTDSPISLYAATKKSNELISYSYSHLYGLNITGLRFFTVYGPYGRPDMSPYIFTKNIIENKSIRVFNHGKHKRDFTYIDDVVSGIMLVLKNPNKSYKIFNIGNNKPIALLRYIEVIENILGKKAIKNMEPIQAGDVENTWADIQDIAYLGYSPYTKIELGMEKFIKWFVDYHKISDIDIFKHVK